MKPAAKNVAVNIAKELGRAALDNIGKIEPTKQLYLDEIPCRDCKIRRRWYICETYYEIYTIVYFSSFIIRYN